MVDLIREFSFSVIGKMRSSPIAMSACFSRKVMFECSRSRRESSALSVLVLGQQVDSITVPCSVQSHAAYRMVHEIWICYIWILSYDLRLSKLQHNTLEVNLL